MKKYLILYQWYETTSQGIIESDNEYDAIKTFVNNIYKLENNQELKKKYGYVSWCLFCWNEDEESFDNAFERYYEENSYLYRVIELKENTVGIITNKGFYNGEDN